MTDEQVSRVFLGLVGLPPRIADLRVLSELGRDPEMVAEYIWDHWMGEPDYPTYEMVLERVKKYAAMN